MARTRVLHLVCLLVLATSSAGGQAGPVPPVQAAEVEALVNRAAELLDDQGRKAFAALRQEGGPWRSGDVYLFVMDMQGTALFNAGQPNREGHDLLEERDVNGKRFHKDFILIVRRFGSGWVDYMFPRPGRADPVLKWSYVCATEVDGTAALVGAGLYID